MRLPTIAVASLAAIVFAGLPAAAAASAGSGIAGRVVAGPTCPVERIPPDPACAPRPLVATVRISGRTLVRLVRTNASGRFSSACRRAATGWSGRPALARRCRGPRHR